MIWSRFFCVKLLRRQKRRGALWPRKVLGYGKSKLSYQHGQHGAGDCGYIDERDMLLVL